MKEAERRFGARVSSIGSVGLREASKSEMEGQAFPRPSGQAIFAALSQEEQDAKIGPEAAELVRSGQAELKDFVGHNRLATDQPNYITQKPVQDAV